MRAKLQIVGAVLALSRVAVPAVASNWCGENGLIRFSFTEGDSLVPVLTTEADGSGMTRVELYVWLTDVDPVALGPNALLHVGGFEMELACEGAEGQVVGKTFPSNVLDVSDTPWQVMTGMNPNPKLVDGRTFLVKYEIVFEGRPENVRFSILPGGIGTCGTVEGCPGTNAHFIYIGPSSPDMLGEVFSAGYEPAWLNPTGEPDLTPVRGTSTWRDVGRFQAR
jgi:hypothetical protein